MRNYRPADWQRHAAQAARAFDAVVRGGIETYDRTIHLPRVLPGADLFGDSDKEQRRLLARLARALRSERNRGRAGHWTYDLNRHIALAQAWHAERRRLRETPPSKDSNARD
jgi:hypothetical protein